VVFAGLVLQQSEALYIPGSASRASRNQLRNSCGRAQTPPRRAKQLYLANTWVISVAPVSATTSGAAAPPSRWVRRPGSVHPGENVVSNALNLLPLGQQASAKRGGAHAFGPPLQLA
jgi:hypothetical protein